ncbi:MAG: type III secretion system chaperone [Pseudomonas sp.]|uniref:type III secretion system chaperone n=1 Tax=Pseudomonas sp. TaxID=306 RepID=UPI003C722676
MKYAASPPLEKAASSWLLQAAERLGVPSSLAGDFARDGVLNLPGMTLQLSPWQTQPVPQWAALGLLRRPDGLPADTWSELLLRANCGASAMSSCSLAMNEAGEALLVQCLSSRPDTDGAHLSDELAHLLALGESLVAAATAFNAGPGSASTPAGQVPLQATPTVQSAQAAMHQDWHRPLLIRALQRLGVSAPAPEQIHTVGVINANGRAFEVIADGDGQHVLVSTPIDTPLRTAGQRERCLRANLHLMLLSRCAIALAPHGSALQARWNCTALNGEDFADWLLDFGVLADSFAAPPSSAATAPRNPAWT